MENSINGGQLGENKINVFQSNYFNLKTQTRKFTNFH